LFSDSFSSAVETWNGSASDLARIVSSRHDLDLAGRQVHVLIAFGAFAHIADHLHDEFAAQRARDFLVVDDDLHQDRCCRADR
jgi:hypothetical protein